MVTLTTDQIKLEPGAFIDQLEAGNEVVIVHNSRSIARAIPETSPPGRPVYGSSAGKILIADDFDAPLPEFAEYPPPSFGQDTSRTA
jgi:antitoxin (DNA-binding transcriptional repressor) of toxin-antitoxin stability system